MLVFMTPSSLLKQGVGLGLDEDFVHAKQARYQPIHGPSLDPMISLKAVNYCLSTLGKRETEGWGRGEGHVI